MVATLIRLDAKQKRRLTRRAKLRGTSLSQEVCEAIDLYLEPHLLAREANRAADRMIRRLDQTIAYVDRGLKQIRKNDKPGQRGG
jgi:hypothetical protein